MHEKGELLTQPSRHVLQFWRIAIEKTKANLVDNNTCYIRLTGKQPSQKYLKNELWFA